VNSKYTAIIDSSVLLGYRESHQDCQNLLYKAIDREINIVISPLTIAKIWSTPGFDRKSEIGFLGLLEFLTVSAIDTDVATKTGHYLRVYSANTEIDLEVANIISICDISGYPLITNNKVLYEGISEDITSCEQVLLNLN